MEPTHTDNKGNIIKDSKSTTPRGGSINQPIHRDRPAIPDDGYDVKSDVRSDVKSDVRTHVPVEEESTLHRVEAKFERLYDQVEHMLTTQLELARTEIGEKVERVENGLISLTTGGVATFFGVQFLLAAAVFGLAIFMPLWGAALIVGGVVLAIGIVLLGNAKSDLNAKRLKPERTMRSVRETADAVRKEL